MIRNCSEQVSLAQGFKRDCSDRRNVTLMILRWNKALRFRWSARLECERGYEEVCEWSVKKSGSCGV
jgi:hypothetical protein